MDKKNVERGNFMMNKAFREPYIHRLKRSYNKYANLADTNRMERQALQLYKEQANKLKETFRRNEMPSATMKEGEKALEAIETLLSSLMSQNFSSDVNVFKDDRYKIDGNSFWSYSKEGKRETLFEDDCNKLSMFIQNLDSALTAFDGVTPAQRKLIESEVKNKAVRIPTKDAFAALDRIYTDPKADTAIKKLIASNMILKRSVGLLKPEEAGMIPQIDNDEAREIIKGISGLLNSLKGGFFEIAVEELLNQAGKEFMSSISSLDGVKITGAKAQGNATVTAKSISKKKTTSKTDLLVNAKVGANQAEMQFGLSLKTSTANNNNNNLQRATKIHTGNLGMLIQRSNSLIEESTYHLFNSAVHLGSESGIFKAAKMKATALLSLDAISGLGTRADTSYFIIYTDKVVSISKYLESISMGNELPFSMNISGLGAGIAEAKKLRKGDTEIERYVRSRNALKIFLSLNATLTSSSS